MYRDMYRIVRQISRYVSYREVTVSLQPYSEVSDGILTKFKPIQAFVADLVTCKNETGPLENESTRVVTTFIPL